jgi:hypothetical protein
MRRSRAAVVLVPVAWLSGCGAYYNEFDVINGTKVEIRDLAVRDGPNVWQLGNLKPGARTTFHGHLSGQDTGTVSWTIAGKRYSAEACFYTVGSAAHGTLTVVGDHLDYRCT